MLTIFFEDVELSKIGTPVHLSDTRRPQHHSRPKKRCPKRLRHPSSRTRSERCTSAQPETITISAVKDFKSPNLPAPEQAQPNWTERNSSGASDIPKPSSRPKRRCRFGPRARRSRNKPCSSDRGITPKAHITLHKQETEDQRHQGDISLDLTRTDFGTLPCRDTLQPAEYDRRTLYGKHLAKTQTHKPEVNPSTAAAKRLGISEAESEEASTKKINDLLGEIEAARLEAQSTTQPDNDTEHRASEASGGLDPLQRIHKEGPPDTGLTSPDTGTQETPTTKRSNKSDSTHYLEGSGTH